ncbi:phosphorylase family protein [Leucobacter sp. W1153]|uniref:phosphorylase family protein n=1 Tax=unclassified Leucobacter TaxID=2621730 RepID=UPI003F2C1CDD
MAEKSLLVFAHSDEATAFVQAGVPHLLTGVGKVNAAMSLTDAIFAAGLRDIERVVVLGTAGVVSDGPSLDVVYQISAAVQHDFSLPSPRLEPAGQLLTETAVIATGDVFVKSDEQRRSIAELGATLVDMETYAYASVCARLGVPLQVFKAPSDFADSSTTDEEWDTVVFTKSDQLFAFAQERLPELLR